LLHRFALLALAVPLSIFSGGALALDFHSTARAAILYDAPSTAAGKVAVTGAGVPLEVIVDTSAWAKVRDVTGRMAWIEKDAFATDHTVMVQAERASVQREPKADAPIVLTAATGVVLTRDMRDGPRGWLAVRHASGRSGWIRRDEVWGE